MTKRMTYTVGFKFKAIELAEATSNRNTEKELGINEKLCGIGGRKRRNSSNYQEQAERFEEVHWPELEVFRRPNNTTYTPLKIEIKISSTKA